MLRPYWTDTEPSRARTIRVRSPSAVRETLNVGRALLHVVVWSAALMGVSHLAASDGPPRAAVTVDEVAFRDLDPADQRMFRRSLEGLTEAEDARARRKDWPTVEALAQRGIPPFGADPLDRAGYRWTLLRNATTINYIGTPAAADRPQLLIAVIEPEPGMVVDPGVPSDETHHRLRDGTMLHVSIYTRPAARTIDAPVPTPAFEDGWRRVTMAP